MHKFIVVDLAHAEARTNSLTQRVRKRISNQLIKIHGFLGGQVVTKHYLAFSKPNLPLQIHNTEFCNFTKRK